jgi:hypothetical protein
MEACDLVSVELRLDRIDAEIANELPPHMRTFARAFARGTALPPAPDVLHRSTTLATARAALAHPLLADRGLALLRLVVPLAIEGDAGVAAAVAASPSWEALAALAAARDAASTARFGHRAIDVLHVLHGSPADADAAPVLPPRVVAWSEPDGITVDVHAISHAWDAIRARHGVDGAVRFERSTAGRPRTFVVQPHGEVVVVIPAQITTPAERFTVLHELGHVLAALAVSAGIPRVVDEAAAAYVARAIEREGEPWFSPAAAEARVRRGALARVLDGIERALPAIVDRPAERPPWALWHDPAAQAAYAAAEAIADAIEREVGPAPAPGAVAAALNAQREQIDRRGAKFL